MGDTDLDEDAQDSQALWPLSSLTQGVIGFGIVMYDVQLRGEGINHLVSPRPPPKGFDPGHRHRHLQHALKLSHRLALIPSVRLFPVSRSFLSLAPTVPVTALVRASPRYLCRCGFTVDLVL